jgi:hypothetical protein
MNEDKYEVKITDDFGNNAKPGALAGMTKDGKFKWMYGEEFERDSITGLFGVPKSFFNQSNPKKGMKTMFTAFALSAIASPVLAWGWDPNGNANNGFAQPSIACGPYYSNQGTGGNFTATSYPSIGNLGPERTYYQGNGWSGVATTYPSVGNIGPTRTYYSGY